MTDQEQLHDAYRKLHSAIAIFEARPKFSLEDIRKLEILILVAASRITEVRHHLTGWPPVNRENKETETLQGS